MKHVVMFSGGVGSWAAAKRVAAKHGTADLVLLFADTCMEDEDLYRFIVEAAKNVGGEFVWLADGRTPWQVFHDERMMGGGQSGGADPCSKILKRKLIDRWFLANFRDPADCVRYIGIDWSEKHRYDRLKERLKPWLVEAPMCDEPFLTKQGMLKWLAAEGICAPRLYRLGFPHNNCGGFCIKAGQAHFEHLLRTMPERYAEHEAKEQAFRDYIGKDVAIMRDRRNGQDKPLTMKAFRERVEHNRTTDLFANEEWGGCGCAVE